MKEIHSDNNSVIIRGGTLLYHFSRNLEQLVSANRFDSRFSRHDLPALYSNCQVNVAEDLHMFDLDQISEPELIRNLWQNGVSLGFDGRIFSVRDPYVRRADGSRALEVVVFRESLYKLGEITVI